MMVEINRTDSIMKKLALFLLGLSFFAAASLRAETAPRGTLLELHSCELYAGGCIVSCEAPFDSRYMLRAWNFTGGSFNGQSLAGLQVALLQTSSANLAAGHTRPDRTLVYLPKGAPDAQRASLLAWVTASQPNLKGAPAKTRIAPLKFDQNGAGCTFTAGDFVSIKTDSLESCDTGACGEALWYTPRSQTTV